MRRSETEIITTMTVVKMKVIATTMKKVTEPVSPTTPGLAGWSRAKAAT